MQTDQLGRLLRIIEEATDRVPYHRTQFLDRFRLRGDAMAERGGAITALFRLDHFKDDFGTHATTMPEAGSSVKIRLSSVLDCRERGCNLVFPFKLASRLVQMFSFTGDTVNEN